MTNISAKIVDRLTKGIKKFQPILAKAQAADINESDTVTIITDILCDVLGYDKYDNVTSEFAIKKTYCDLAIKLDGTVPLLLECKAAGIDLKDDHVRQATNYAADSGIEWVILTNGVSWKVYKIIFSQPIDKQLVYEFKFSELNPKKQADIEMLYYLSIEAFSKSSKAHLDDFYAQKQIFNKYTIGQLILNESVISGIKRAIKHYYPDVKIDAEELVTMLNNDVLKRDVIDSEQALEAKKALQKIDKKLAATAAKATKKENEPKE